MDKIKVLIADDSTSIKAYVASLLTQWGYDVTACSSGDEVWDTIQGDTYFPVIILDWIMPGLTGMELCNKIKTMQGTGYRYIILLTGKSNLTDIIEGLNGGADDYLTKPFQPEELQARLNVATRFYKYEMALASKEHEVRVSCYKALTEMAEARDYETGSHLIRIADLSTALAEEMKLDAEFIHQLHLFAPMHDIGKVGIPDGILHLPRRLTQPEMEIMKTHSVIGWEILKGKETLEIAAEIAYTHHEKWDGSGYPRSLREEEIPLAGRIVSVVDVYDAMRSARPYKTPFTHKVSIDWITSAAGESFDPDIIKAFKTIEDKICGIFESEYEQNKNLNTTPSGRRILQTAPTD